MEIVDAVGMYCPMPVILVARSLRKLKIDEQVELLADDAGIIDTLENWCKGSGQGFVSLIKDEDNVYHGIVKRLK